jgi:hypothetical protein
MSKNFEGEVYLTIEEAAAYTYRKKSTILAKYKSYGWGVMWLGRSPHFNKNDIREWLKDPRQFKSRSQLQEAV